MNETYPIERDRNYLSYEDLQRQKRAAKKMRKFVRKVVRADLQRRAIEGGPSPFKRAAAQ